MCSYNSKHLKPSPENLCKTNHLKQHCLVLFKGHGNSLHI